jgi:SAM-dependent methyltransferase
VTPVTAYDRIARWYDVDMARNMAHDDIGLYRALALACRGHVLELGCGNGRVLLELLRAGCDAVGVDRSAGMLRELQGKAEAQDLSACIAQMDVRALALAPGYALVLAPYSLVTYMVSDEDAGRFLAETRRVLLRTGTLVVDAFVPRVAVASSSFEEDYRRPCSGGELARARRITTLEGGVNRIERRYVLRDREGAVVEQEDTVELIRARAPAELCALLSQHGYAIESTWWDYGARASAADAQFMTLRARLAR